MTYEQTPSSATGVVAADILASMSGLDFLQRIGDGRFPGPPIAELLGFRPEEVEEGRAVFVSTPDALSTIRSARCMADTPRRCSIPAWPARSTRCSKPVGAIRRSNETAAFVRPISADTGEVRAEGKIIHFGRQIASAEGRLTDARGRLLAHATTTCLVFSFPASHGVGETPDGAKPSMAADNREDA